MRWVLDRAPEGLLGLPCERDPDWIVRYLTSLARVATLQTVREGRCTSYDDLPAYRVRRGHRLTAADVTLGRVDEITKVLAARGSLERECGPLPRCQVGIPNPLDLAMFVFGPAARATRPMRLASAMRAAILALRHLPVFRAAVVDEITELHTSHEDLVFQLETPAVLCGLSRVPRRVRSMLCRLLAGQVADVLLSAPHGTRWSVHLCYGDLGHHAMVAPKDLSPAVEFLNALTKRLHRCGRDVPPVHLPIAYGDQPPPLERAFFRPLRDLHGHVRVIAGLIDEHHPEATQSALQLCEQELGRPVAGVAAACGLGRRTADEAEANLLAASRIAGLTETLWP